MALKASEQLSNGTRNCQLLQNVSHNGHLGIKHHTRSEERHLSSKIKKYTLNNSTVTMHKHTHTHGLQPFSRFIWVSQLRWWSIKCLQGNWILTSGALFFSDWMPFLTPIKQCQSTEELAALL